MDDYTASRIAVLARAREELTEIETEMVDPDLDPDDPDALTIFDLLFHTFEMPDGQNTSARPARRTESA